MTTFSSLARSSLVAGALSGPPSTVHALVTGRNVLDAGGRLLVAWSYKYSN
jgi:hypothetical protein